MNPRTFHSLGPLLDAARRRRPRTVTVDIFDTLMIRRTSDPDQVKRPVAQFIAERARALGIHVTLRQVWQCRNRIETAHRRRNGAVHPDHEACYDQFMPELLEEIFGDRLPEGLFDEVADYEMQVEQSMIVVRAGLESWLREVKDDGGRVLLVSDIYLPARLLERLAAAKGLAALVDGVQSSADTCRAKASGAAFPLLRERFAIEPSGWLHVGDNPISDGLRPAQFGIDAMVLRDGDEKHRRTIARTLHRNAADSHFWRGRLTQQLMLPLEAENVERPPLYVDGYNLFGFLIGYFTLNLLERCRHQGIDRIYFCSREGWTLQRYWERAAPILAPAERLPQTGYLYVSRLALAKAACGTSGLSIVSASSALLPAQNRDFRDVCRVFGLDIGLLRPHLDRFGLRDEDPIGPMTPGVTPELRRRFTDMLADPEFRADVTRQARPVRDLVLRYLENQGFFAQRDVALVDIGWLGTIQHYLAEAIADHPERPRLHGYLLGATRLMPYAVGSEASVDGVLYDRFRFDFSESLVTLAKDLFEESCRAPHPSVIGYRDNGQGAVEPVLRAADDAAGRAEHEQNLSFAPLRDGILDSAPRFAAAVRLMNYISGDLKPWLNFLLICRLAFPRTAEVARMRHTSHQDDFAGSGRVPRRLARINRTLWDRSLTALRFSPLLRLRSYLGHALGLLRS